MTIVSKKSEIFLEGSNSSTGRGKRGLSTSQFTRYNVGVARLIVFSYWGEVIYDD